MFILGKERSFFLRVKQNEFYLKNRIYFTVLEIILLIIKINHNVETVLLRILKVSTKKTKFNFYFETFGPLRRRRIGVSSKQIIHVRNNFNTHGLCFV